MIDTLAHVDGYVGVSFDQNVSFPNGRTFRVIVYGAFNAYGLIGPELNGIAVFDDDTKWVVADELGRIDTGYFGPSEGQLELAGKIVAMGWDEFRVFINGQATTRYPI